MASQYTTPAVQPHAKLPNGPEKSVAKMTNWAYNESKQYNYIQGDTT